MLGAAVGSFLNVVIYRSPRGMSLLHPGSHCPACRHPIRVRDNVPVLGWLLLRGRCRDCGTKISARYPLIEGMVALLFVGMAALYLGLGGETLPLPARDLSDTFGWTERRLTFICGFHLLLITYLLAAAGMRFDGQRVPGWLTIGIAVAGFVLPCIWPWLRPQECGFAFQSTPWIDGLIGGIAGAVLGWIVGGDRLRWLAPPARINFAYVVVGAFLGWQAVLMIACIATACGVLLAMLGRVKRTVEVQLPDETTLVVAVLLLLANWAWVTEFTARRVPSGWMLLAAGLLLVSVLSVCQRRLRARNPS
jgi:leader peptidase (prepilin peptidase)/N-methyltransferase